MSSRRIPVQFPGHFSREAGLYVLIQRTRRVNLPDDFFLSSGRTFDEHTIDYDAEDCLMIVAFVSSGRRASRGHLRSISGSAQLRGGRGNPFHHTLGPEADHL